jgi:L-aspartate oxidase
MEFYQFHPTALHMPGVTPFLISEAVRGEGGVLCNVEGRRFMTDYTPEGDLASRDVVSRSILYEMQKTASDNVFIDVTHLPEHVVTTRFPHIFRFCLEHGLDITKELIPVAPAAHYMIGGVRTNSWGETNIEGLFACGETACAGVHGANRLASNSLLDAVVFSKRIIMLTAGNAEAKKSVERNDNVHIKLSIEDKAQRIQSPGLYALQTLLWNTLSIIRSKEGLSVASDTLKTWHGSLPRPADRASYELSNLVLIGRLMAEAAVIREESRGAHFRTDFPKSSPEWRRHIIFTNG